MASTVRLGFALKTGAPVEIPIGHTVVTGITQLAGKTTTLEALLSRAPLRALAFVTKRGEGAFADGRDTQPYFREQTDWRFVASILEASLGEKMRFERGWIMRASKGAKTLADVQRNVRRLMGKAKGLSADVYYQLDQYLEEIVPEIDLIEWARRIELTVGLNVMDLTSLGESMQHLVIRSSMLWLLENAEDTIVVVPEAWKFAPEGRGSPVKLAAEAFVRQGAALGNYLWLDSQDITGVDKRILKQCSVWLLGVQRELNEIKRTLAQIPASTSKPKPEQIATLELGQFIACFGKHAVPTYVQPAWMYEAHAQQVATGLLDVHTANRLPHRSATPEHQEETNVKESEAREIRATNQRLERENADLRRRLDALEASAPSSNGRPEVALPVRTARNADAGSTPAGADSNGELTDQLTDQLYDAIRVRLLKDPVALKVATTKSAIDVEVRINRITIEGTTWLGRVAQLAAEGFFDDGPKKTGEVHKEAVRRGASGIPARADEAVKKLWQMGFLTREPDGFRAVPGMKVNLVEAD